MAPTIFLIVFVPSIVLTAVIGLFIVLTWNSARSRRALGLYWGAALAVHLLWWWLLNLHGVLGSAARWLTIVWIGAVIAGVLLIIPFAVAVIGQRFLVGRAAARRSPLLAVYAGLSLACGVGVAIGSTGAPRVRQAEVRINGLPAALDGLRIANLGDVHVGPFSKAYDYVQGPFENGGASLDVSAGAGDWLPVRIFTPREIVIITLGRVTGGGLAR